MAIKCISQDDQDLICKKYLQEKHYSISDLSRDYNVSRPTIRKILRNKGITTKSRSMSCRTKELNDNAFSTVNEFSAYWIGFILADGNVRRNKLTVHLSNVDVIHLKKLKSFLKSSHKITINEDNEDCTYSVTSKKLLKDLSRFGIIPNKTYTDLKSLNEELTPFMSHFIRGYFDGDGTLHINMNGTPNNTYFGIYSNSKTFLLNIKEFIENELDLKLGLYPSRDLYVIRKNGGQYVTKIMEYLYKGSLEEIRLDRKYNKYKTGLLGE